MCLYVFKQQYIFFADPHLIFQASISCSKMLLSLDPKPPAVTVMGMLQSGHTLMALSTLMFAPVPLEQVRSTLCVSGGVQSCMEIT